MTSTSRPRLCAALLALTLALGACGGPDGGDAPAPQAAADSAAATSPATDTPSPESASSSPSASGGSTSSAMTSSAPSTSAAAPQSDDTGAGQESTSAATHAEEAEDARGAAESSSAGSAEGQDERGSSAEGRQDASAPASSASPSRPGADARTQDRPAPVVAQDRGVPAAQDLGGPKPGVAPEDTPVAVATPKPVIPVERIAPQDVRPAPVQQPASPRPAAPSASAGTSATAPGSSAPSASAPASSTSAAPQPSTAPAPAGPVRQAPVDCAVTRCIALTFDDGPGRHTGRLLDVLSAEQVPATFYVVGQSAKLNPAMIARMAAEGHQVGNHSYTHPNLTTLTAGQVRQEIAATDAAVRAAGVSPSTVRAPYGALNESVLATLGGLPRAGSVTWSVDTRDWEHRSPAQTLAAVKAGARPGGIVLMHDIHSTTVDAVPAVIAHLRSEGYTFVTVDRITGGVAAGHTTGSGLHP